MRFTPRVTELMDWIVASEFRAEEILLAVGQYSEQDWRGTRSFSTWTKPSVAEAGSWQPSVRLNAPSKRIQINRRPVDVMSVRFVVSCERWLVMQGMPS